MATWFDPLLILAISLSMLAGLIRGFLKEILGLFIWALAIWATWHYVSFPMMWVSQYIVNKTLCLVISSVLLFLSVLISGGMVSFCLGRFLSLSGLSHIDRFFGIIFGFLRGVVVVAFILAVLRLTSLPLESVFETSKLYYVIHPAVRWCEQKIPSLIEKANQVEQSLTGTTKTTVVPA